MMRHNFSGFADDDTNIALEDAMGKIQKSLEVAFDKWAAEMKASLLDLCYDLESLDTTAAGSETRAWSEGDEIKVDCSPQVLQFAKDLFGEEFCHLAIINAQVVRAYSTLDELSSKDNFEALLKDGDPSACAIATPTG